MIFIKLIYTNRFYKKCSKNKTVPIQIKPDFLLNFDAEHSSNCICIVERRLAISEEQKLNCCDIYMNTDNTRYVSFLAGFTHFILYCQHFIPILMPAVTFTLKLPILEVCESHCGNL